MRARRLAGPAPAVEVGVERMADEPARRPGLQAIQVGLHAARHHQVAVGLAQHPAGERCVQRPALVGDQIVAHQHDPGAPPPQGGGDAGERRGEERDPPLVDHGVRGEALEGPRGPPPAQGIDRVHAPLDGHRGRRRRRVQLAAAREQQPGVLAREREAAHLVAPRQGLGQQPQVLGDAPAPGMEGTDQGDPHAGRITSRAAAPAGRPGTPRGRRARTHACTGRRGFERPGGCGGSACSAEA